jgi:hypothetical protein
MSAQSGDKPIGVAEAATELEPATEIETRSAVESEPRVAPARLPDPTDQIGRFTVVEKLGAGGMGIVVAAHDPTLDRKVAIKMLHGERWTGAETRGRAQLIAEAQAMAKLAHPNVVALHEVGFDRDGAFLVMEYVAGTNLRGWLEDVHAWPEILAMFLAAGEGLAAAHRAGMVHRDFKPDNVLVDRDGRARVGDFGLAAVVEGARVAGSRSGTLPYMAPEQLRGEPCDARADQFAYCVALWQGLHGNRPFAGTTADERLAEIEARRFVEPLRRPPEWLRQALVRGLATDPAARWPSMEALLAALRRDPRARRRKLVAGAIAALAAVALWLAWPARAGDPCDAGAARLAGVWDPVRKAEVQVQFAATGLPYAGALWPGVRDRLDRYATDWVAGAADACRATRVDGRQSDTLMDLRMACLDQRRGVVDALTTTWARGITRDGLEHALDAVTRLPALVDCSDTRALAERTPAPANPVQRALIDDVRRQLAELEAGRLARRLSDARALAGRARAAADATAWPPIRAQAALAEAEVLRDLEDAATATHLIEASQLADAAHDDPLRARALILLVADLAERQQKLDDAARFADLADGALARAGDSDALHGLLVHARGQLLLAAGKLPEARATLEDARARLARAVGPADQETIATVLDLARTASKQADYAAARKIFDDGLAVARPALGPEHPQVARLLGGLAAMQLDSGDLAGAAASFAAALAIDERVFGPDGLETAHTLNNFARLESRRHRAAAAIAMFARALAIRERALGPDHPMVATALSNLALQKVGVRDFRSALPDFQRALEIKLKAYGPNHVSVGQTYQGLGNVYEAMRDLPAALGAYQRAAATYTAALGPHHETTLRGLGRAAQILVELHRCAEAVPQLERLLAELGDSDANAPTRIDSRIALATCDLEAGHPAPALKALTAARARAVQLESEPAAMGEIDWRLARATWALGRPDEAHRWIRQAITELTGDPDTAATLAEARAWLAAHPR